MKFDDAVTYVASVRIKVKEEGIFRFKISQNDFKASIFNLKKYFDMRRFTDFHFKCSDIGMQREKSKRGRLT